MLIKRENSVVVLNTDGVTHKVKDVHDFAGPCTLYINQEFFVESWNSLYKEFMVVTGEYLTYVDTPATLSTEG